MAETRQNPAERPREINREGKNAGRGRLKIFFGYGAGVGKTYAMLKAAHAAKRRGIDVAAGYIEVNGWPQTAALLNGLEQLPARTVEHDAGRRQEFDIDAALSRRPRLILVDELAHVNAPGCRHAKRYQDVEELLKESIDVYTTVNVQDIESLNDLVTSITGVTVLERIPDSVFDQADQVEMVDIEPRDLMERLQTDGVYQQGWADFFTAENLTALRELALRRFADRVNLLAENDRLKNNGNYHTDEHILVCLSSAPSNEKIIRTAARMASAFRGAFTALFVETPDFSSMTKEDKKRLRANTRLAQQLGANIETVYGDDVPYQIAEFARLSGVSKIVIGRSAAAKKHFFGKPALTEKLIAAAPNLDIYVIPDASASFSQYHEVRARRKGGRAFSAADIFKSIGILLAASAIGAIFDKLGLGEINIITIYILGVLITSVVTRNTVYSLLASLVSVFLFNFLFTEPRYTFMAYDSSYPVTFLVMFVAALITGSLAARLKSHAKQSAQAAFRTKVLFETNQLLQRAQNRDEIINVTASQLMKLLNRNIIVYPAEKGSLEEPRIFSASGEAPEADWTSEAERAVAGWVLKNNKHAGATTDTLSDAKCLYLSIRVNQNIYGVAGIVVGENPPDAFETSIMLSILGESALAMENEKNAKEKEEAAIQVKNEQLRTNLLRAISHDLRTPLTSISGNASNLLTNGDAFDEEAKKQVYTDIHDDALWLINLVENLLSVTRLGDGQMNLHLSAELMEDVVAEALRHVNRQCGEHSITVEHRDEFLLARMDAKLIVQVIINIVDNAVKYTPKGSHIRIETRREGDWAVVRISDDGPGISDEAKPRVFDMFYSGANKVADSRRSLGLGLSLCKSIITVHGGEIQVGDNKPQGAVFTFTLPAEEAHLNE